MGKQSADLGIHKVVTPNGIRWLVDSDGDIVANLDSLSPSDVNNPDVISYLIKVQEAYSGVVKNFAGMPYIFLTYADVQCVPKFGGVLERMDIMGMEGIWVSVNQPQMGLEAHPVVEATINNIQTNGNGDMRLRQLKFWQEA